VRSVYAVSAPSANRNTWRETVRKSLTAILFQQQISHALNWDQIRTFAVRHQGLSETWHVSQ